MSGPCVTCGARGKLVESGQAQVGGGASGRAVHYLSLDRQRAGTKEDALHPCWVGHKMIEL